MELIFIGFSLIVGVLVGRAAAQKKGFSPIAGAIGGLLLGFLSPLLFLVSARRKCPHCAKWINTDAKVCKHCGRDVESIIRPAAPDNPNIRRIFLAIASLLLLGMAWTGLSGGLRQLPQSQAVGEKARALAHIVYGLLSLLSIVTVFRGRRWGPLVSVCWIASVTLAFGLAPIWRGTGLATLSAGAWLLIALGIVWLLRAGSPPRPAAPDQPNILLVIGAIFLLLVNTSFFWSIGLVDGDGDAAYALGAALVPTGIVLVVYGVARAIGKGGTRSAKARIAFWTMTVVFVSNFTRLSLPIQKRARTSVTDAERHGLQIDSDSIWHPSFGFVLPHPGADFHLDPDVQGELDTLGGAHPDEVAWDLSRARGLEIVEIHVARAFRVNEYLGSVASGFRSAATESDTVRVLEDTLIWTGQYGEYRRAAYSAGGYLKTRCLASSAREAGSVVCVSTASDQPDGLDFVRTGLTVKR